MPPSGDGEGHYDDYFPNIQKVFGIGMEYGANVGTYLPQEKKPIAYLKLVEVRNALVRRLRAA